MRVPHQETVQASPSSDGDHNMAKLTKELADRILALRAGGFTLAEISKRVGISKSQISLVIRGELTIPQPVPPIFPQ